MKKLIAIIAYNEAQTISTLVHDARDYADTVLVVDDGSDDDTSRIAQRAGATVLTALFNRGKGAAVRDAFTYAHDEQYDILVLMDGDGQHNPGEVPLFVGPVSNGSQVAIGFRVGLNSEMPFYRRIGKRVLDYSTALLGGGLVTDSQCGFRAFNRIAIEALAPRLRSDGFEIESEQLIHAHSAGLKVSEVPITCRYEGLDTSTKGPFAHGFGVMFNLLKLTVQSSGSAPSGSVPLPRSDKRKRGSE